MSTSITDTTVPIEESKTDAIVNLRHISKVFGSLRALDDVHFDIRRGEILGLLGENGAGKSTLMNILYGLYQPTSGEILIDGEKVKIDSPVDSLKKGIGMVHQTSTLVPEFNAVENIMIGMPGDTFSLPIAREREKIKETAEKVGLNIPLNEKVKNLSAGDKQKIEIIRCLYRGARLLILDEPTTALVESEFEQLLETLRSLVKNGVTVVLITHKMREVMEACDRVTILRKGKVQGSLNKEEMTKERLVKLMFAEKDLNITESALPQVELPEKELSPEPMLVLKNVYTPSRSENIGLKDVSFEIYGGEIFGIAAVSGSGERALASCIMNPQIITEGDILLRGKSMKGMSTMDVLAAGVSYTPEDRHAAGILQGASIRENMLLGHHKEEQFRRRNLFVDWRAISRVTNEKIKEFNVDTVGEHVDIARLSGGNAQKVIIARALINNIDLFVTQNPTMGLDFATVEFIFKKMIEIRSQGKAVLWINSDLDELMILADRIGVFYNGELRGIFNRDEFDKYLIGSKMIGG